MTLATNPTRQRHFIGMSGNHGCLPDFVRVYSTRREAVEVLADMFELGRTRKAALSHDSYLDLSLGRDGAEYCEVVECDCAKPWEHGEDDKPEDWGIGNAAE